MQMPTIEERQKQERRELIDALKTARVRLYLCLGRMRACKETNPNEHDVSVEEIPYWLQEMDEMIARLEHER